MLENAVFSVISPEGCASILWDAASREAAAEAAKCLCITAEDMKRFGIAERIINENFSEFEKMCEDLKETLQGDLKEIYQDAPKISEKRYERFRKLGSWTEKK